MRQEFVECRDRRTAKRRMTWASKIKKVDGGFIGFESWTDYENWKKQN